MNIYNIQNYKDGWFIGDFEPTVLKTKDFEVCFKTHKKDEIWPKHYHQIATEINYMIKGEMLIQGKNLKAGDIFTLEPNEWADPIFLQDCELIVVKTPSVKGDKYEN